MHAPETLKRSLPSAAFRGRLSPGQELEKPKPLAPVLASDGLSHDAPPPPLASLLSLQDFEAVARRFLPAHAWAYYASGADDEVSKRQNRKAYRRVFMRPRILRKVQVVSTHTSILGVSTSLPVYVSAVGIAKYAHPDGECALARAAGHEGLIQVVANGASYPIESIMDARVQPDQAIFWQLYVNKDIALSEAMVRRAQKAGVGAIWLTVDSPVVGKREMDERLNLQIQVRHAMRESFFFLSRSE